MLLSSTVETAASSFLKFTDFSTDQCKETGAAALSDVFIDSFQNELYNLLNPLSEV